MTQAPDKFTGVGSDPFGHRAAHPISKRILCGIGRAGLRPTAREHEKKRTSLDAPRFHLARRGLRAWLVAIRPRHQTPTPLCTRLQGPLATGSGQGSGGHDPNSSETYPFGEPSCNGGGKTPRHALSPVQPRGERNNHTDPFGRKMQISDLPLRPRGFVHTRISIFCADPMELHMQHNRPRLQTMD